MTDPVGTKISELPVVDSLDGTELLPLVKGAHTVAVLLSKIAILVSANPDAAALLTALAGQITVDQLATDLATAITTITGSQAVVGSAAWQVLQESNARAAAITQEVSDRSAAVLAEAQARGTDITSEQTTRQTADEGLASQIDTLTTNLGTASAAIQTEATTRADADTALSTRVDTVAAGVASNTSAISTEETARADADTALANSITALTATVGGNTSAIADETTARSDADTALAGRVSTLEAETGGTNVAARITAAEQAITDETSARANAVSQLTTNYQTADTTIAGSVTTETQARSDADTALASRASAVEATLAGTGGATVMSLIADEASTRSTADTTNANATSTLQSSFDTLTGTGGRLATVEAQSNTSATALGVVEANSTIKVQAMSNGKQALAGIGLNATTDGVTTQSEIILMADELQIASDTSDTPRVLFQIGTQNGGSALILVPTFIGDLSVNTLQIANQAVTIPVGVYTQGSTGSSSNWVTPVDVQDATIVSTGAPIAVLAGCYVEFQDNSQTQYEITVTVVRDTTFNTISQATWYQRNTSGSSAVIRATTFTLPPILDTPGPGSHTYSLLVSCDQTAPILQASSRGIVLLETKK